MKTETTVAIVTRKRPCELEHCLDSLLQQSNLPDQVIIIDNDPAQSARRLSSHQKYISLHINYQHITGTVPKCRNFAINHASSKYLAFIDDDCVLDINWLTAGLQNIKHTRVDFVLGLTKLLNPHNICALAQYARDAYWKDYNQQLFDTKNVIFKLEIIKKKQLNFDEHCQVDRYDSADFDFDFQSQQVKLKKTYCPEMILFHQEVNNVYHFKKRAYWRGYLGNYLNNKWHLKHSLVDLRDQKFWFFILKNAKNFFKNYRKYQLYMDSAPQYQKYLANLLIGLFERYYTLGYVQRQKEVRSQVF